jgi:hypothetical protein
MRGALAVVFAVVDTATASGETAKIVASWTIRSNERSLGRWTAMSYGRVSGSPVSARSSTATHTRPDQEPLRFLTRGSLSHRDPRVAAKALAASTRAAAPPRRDDRRRIPIGASIPEQAA